MKIKSLRFGEIEIEDKEVIQFKRPILGFENESSFVLLHDPEYKPFMWLQSINTSELAFVVVDPWLIDKDYYLDLGDSLKSRVQITNQEQVLVLTIVTIPENHLEMTANLRAPLVINLEAKIGEQIVLSDERYNIRHRILE